MKKTIIFLFFAYFLCSSQKNITIKGYFDESFNGQILVMGLYDNNYQDSQLEDSAIIKNGTYEIKDFEINHPGLYKVFVRSGGKYTQKIENIYLDGFNKTYLR